MKNDNQKIDELYNLIKENNKLLYLIINQISDINSVDEQAMNFLRSIGANLVSNIINDKLLGKKYLV